MTFRLAEPDTADGATPGWIVADGTITKDSADQFRTFLRTKKISVGARTEVFLNSRGGNLFGGLSLGEVIREYGLGTKVARSIPDPPHGGEYVTESEGTGLCLSACAFTFLGGKSRIAADRTIGVHQHYDPAALQEPQKQFTAADLSSEQIISGILADYVVRMGVDARFLTRASSASPTEIYLFTSDEMYQFAITWKDSEYMPWALEAYRDGLIAVSKTRNEQEVATLFCRKGKSLSLLLSIPYFGSANDDLSPIINGATVDVFGTEIPSSNISAKIEKNHLVFEFRLPSEFKIKNDATYGMGAVGSFRQLYYHDFPARNFLTYLRLVSRNCF
jgi:hypothetical protein